MERAVILETTPEIRPESLPDFQLETRLRKPDLNAPPKDMSLEDRVAQYERELILSILEENNYNLTKTAEQLKISRHALRYRIHRLNIETGDTFEEENPLPAGKETA